MLLKQSTAVVLSFGPFVDPTDGVTLVTGLVSALDNGSTGIKLSKNGGALTIRHATVTATTYDAYGMYLVTLDTTDTNTLGAVRVAFAAAASCLPVWQDFQIVPANVYDSQVAGSTVLDVNASKLGGTSQTGRDLGTSVLLSSGTGTGQVSLASGKVSLIAADIGAVWDVVSASHVGAGTTGLALASAASAGDPWATAIPGAYSAGTAGFIVGNNLNATVSSRLASSGYTVPPTAIENADEAAKRDWTLISGEAAHSNLNAMRFLRNVVDASNGTTLIVKKEDGTTNAWTQPITTNTLALPIVKVG